jgi:hypothetical protein
MHVTVVINDRGEKAANEAAAIDRAKVLARQLEGGVNRVRPRRFSTS